MDTLVLAMPLRELNLLWAMITMVLKTASCFRYHRFQDRLNNVLKMLKTIFLEENLLQQGKNLLKPSSMTFDLQCSLKINQCVRPCARSQAVIFPGQLDHVEGEEYTSYSGTTGTCERSCGHTVTWLRFRGVL